MTPGSPGRGAGRRRGRGGARGAALGAAVWCIAGGALSAQTAAEVRGGLMVGNHTSTAAGLEWVPEPSYEVRITRQVRPGVALSAGYLRTSFGCTEGFCRGSEPTVTGTHAAVGAQLSRGPLWARVGALYGAVRVGSEGEAPLAGLGIEAGAGIRVPIGRLSIRPGVSWRRMAADTPSRSDRAVALGIDLGIRLELE